jgi:hypothetical protein
MSDATALPTDSEERKNIPIARGLLDYFPSALAEVARLSIEGNRKHVPDFHEGGELVHMRNKSGDHADCIMRHLIERGTQDTDGFLHDVKVAWRALAMLQQRLEDMGAPIARAARFSDGHCENDADLRIPHSDAAYTRIKDEYYNNDRKPVAVPICAHPECDKRADVIDAYYEDGKVYHSSVCAVLDR